MHGIVHNQVFLVVLVCSQDALWNACSFSQFAEEFSFDFVDTFHDVDRTTCVWVVFDGRQFEYQISGLPAIFGRLFLDARTHFFHLPMRGPPSKVVQSHRGPSPV